MGSIVSITTKKEVWKLTGKEAKLKVTGEKIIEVIIGDADYDYEGLSYIKIWMRKLIYDNVMSGKYIIDKNSHRQIQLTILDEVGQKIQPFDKDFVY